MKSWTLETILREITLAGLVMKDRKLMKNFEVYIRCKLAYWCVVWSPSKQAKINKFETTHKRFTSIIEGMDHMNYQKLKDLKLNSLAREGRGI